MNTTKNIRILIGIVLIFGILATVAYMIKNKDSFFTSKTNIKYPDGCVEEYKNDILLTKECTMGRELYKKQLEGNVNVSKSPYSSILPILTNITLNNLTQINVTENLTKSNNLTKINSSLR